MMTGETDVNGSRGTRIFRDMECSASELRQATTKQIDSRTAISAALANWHITKGKCQARYMISTFGRVFIFSSRGNFSYVSSLQTKLTKTK